MMHLELQSISANNGKRTPACAGNKPLPVHRLPRILSVLGWAGFVWMVSAIFNQVFAQADVGNVLAPYQNFRPAEDLATRVMEGLLGATYTSPFTVGLTASTLFGAIFIVFNIIVFAAGTVFASYGVVSSIVSTAHEGVVLGKRMNAIWMPIRMVTGIGGLVPAFGGFSLSQVVMLLATALGISFGNFAYDQALTAANTSATLTNPSISRTNPKSDGPALASALFEQRLCELKAQHDNEKLVREGAPPATEKVVRQYDFASIADFKGIKTGTLVGLAYGTNQDATSCWAVGLKRKTFFFGTATETGRSGSSLFGFRSGAVNYESINQQTWTGYASNFPAFAARVKTLADTYAAAKDLKGNEVPRPDDQIRAEGVNFTGLVQSTVTEHKNINDAALANMRKYGFFGAGSYYSTHAEVNAAVMQAADAVDFVMVAPKTTTAPVITGDYDFSYGTPETAVGAVAGDLTTFNKTDFCIVKQTETGNCSIGQRIIGLILDAGTAGAGGASTVVDPIIAMKNIGDYMMLIGDAALALHAGGAVAKTVAGVGAVATGAAGAASVATGVGAPIGLGAIAMASLTTAFLAIGPMLPFIGGAFLTVGALCAIYIPMVPFLNWVSALVQYLCIVVESFAAAPLWAFAHLQAEGEGMGQRSERGYLYILNLLFRPLLMVVAFFAASALVILLGSIVMQMYLPAVAAAQGNSLTGLFSVIGYVFLFFIIMNTVIQGLFHLTSELADDAIGWIGGVGRQNIGKDTEGKVNNLFIAGGRMAAGGVSSMAGKATMARNVTNPEKSPGLPGGTPRTGNKK